MWGTKGNFLDLPTDCPQRNERLGWTGDIAVFAPSAAFLYDVGPFLADWLVDLDLEQSHADGMVSFVVPDVLKYLPSPTLPAPESTAVWSDAAVWVPWALWQAYGDRGVLERQYASMAAHVRRVETLLSPTGLWDTGFQFGDWLDPDAPPDAPAKAKADTGVVATAAFYRSRRSSPRPRAARPRRGRRRVRGLADRTRAAFNEHYVVRRRHGRSDCTTVYTLAIVFGLLDDDDRGVSGRPARPARGRERLPDLDRIRRHAVHHRRADPDRAPRRRLPAAAGARVPVVALPRDHGRHHDLGAVGLDAARRHHQPG